MWWVWGLLALPLLLIAALAVPVDVAVDASREERTRFTVRIRWLWGLVRKRIEGPRMQAEPTDPADARGGEVGDDDDRDGGEGRGMGNPLAFLRARGASAALRRFVRRATRAVRVRRLDIDGEVGTGDPAETGQLFGAIGPLIAVVGSVPRTRVDVRPTFGEPAARGRAAGELRAVPIVALAAATMFVLAPGTIRGLRAMRRSRR